MPTQLHIYDFDKTLFASPEKPDWWTKGWWSRPESLGPPCVPDRPTADWWNSSVVSSAKRSNSDPDVVSILVTGRLVKRFHHRVRDLLRQAGLRFDSVNLAPGGASTETAKLKIFAEALAANPEITHVEIWEDRSEHIGKFKSFFEAQGLQTKAHLVKIAPHEVACGPDLKMAHAVVARHLEARATKNYRFMEALFKDLKAAWDKLPRRNPWGEDKAPGAGADANAKAFARVSKNLLDELKITSNAPGLAKGLKKYEGKFRLFRKMLTEWSKADSWDELREAMDSQATRSRSTWNKFYDYQEIIMGLLANVDSEQDTTIHVGPYTVVLMTAHNHDWNSDRVEKVRHVLKKVDGYLSRIGMDAISGGLIYAYPTKLLPASAMVSHNALAYYHPGKDHMGFAAEGDPRKLIDTMLHELGHRAYFKLVEGRGRSAWSDFFEGGLGTPDIDSIIGNWEKAITRIEGEERQWRGRFFGYYLPTLQKSDRDEAMWLNMLFRQLGIKEKFNPYTGKPKKSLVPGLDQLIDKRGEAKVFLYPVTAYSGTSAEELFAETFQAFATKGGQHVHPLVEHAFKMTIPKFRMARTASQGYGPCPSCGQNHSGTSRTRGGKLSTTTCGACKVTLPSKTWESRRPSSDPSAAQNAPR